MSLFLGGGGVGGMHCCVHVLPLERCARPHLCPAASFVIEQRCGGAGKSGGGENGTVPTSCAKNWRRMAPYLLGEICAFENKSEVLKSRGLRVLVVFGPIAVL